MTQKFNSTINKLLAPVPPMGWNSWNTFYDKISEELIFGIADAMVENGLKDAGYEYLIIDDCWSKKERDANGCLVPDPEKFPNGLKAVADYVHSKGLKLGIYSCCGVRTCGGYPGSFEHETGDAAQFAALGVDYLKYDNCHRPNSQTSEMLYRRMALALRNCGRDIVFAACQWGTENVYRWIRSTGAHTFRSTVDVQDSWSSIESIALARLEQPSVTGPDCFNDMDMLVVGMNGKGFNPETSIAGGISGCTSAEYETHFALWAMFNSPLILGCDVREMSVETRNLVTNPHLIAINQDVECREPYRLTTYANPDVFVLVKPLSGGDIALGFFNFSDVPFNVPLCFWDLGISDAAGYGLRLFDCLKETDLGTMPEYFAPETQPHGCRIFRASVVRKECDR